MLKNDIITQLSDIRKKMRKSNDYRLTVHLKRDFKDTKTTHIDIIENFYRFEIKYDSWLYIYSKYEETVYPLEELQAFLEYKNWLRFEENCREKGIKINTVLSDYYYKINERNKKEQRDEYLEAYGDYMSRFN